MSSDLTFLTNEEDRKLSVRLNDLLSKSERFDCLAGYFYLSGFYLVEKSMEPCEKIRILIGMHTEQEVYDAVRRSKVQNELNFRSQQDTINEFAATVLKQLETADESEEVENGIEQFVRWCGQGKVEVRAYDKHDIHAKLYIFGFDKNQIDKGRVITGSSNLSRSGLDANFEFNVELKDRGDYEFASKKFEELWKESVEVTEKFIRTVNEESHLALFSPCEIYLKFLYEYFRTELNQPRELEEDYLPDRFLKLQYQQDAVLTAKRIAEEYGGVFLADVVGLGKTYMAAMLARELKGRSLVIAPPALVDRSNPGAWQNVFHDFGVRGFYAESLGKLDKLLRKDLSKYENIFVDEAHRFRNENTESYTKLHRICRGKRVILVTATPYNNKPDDLLSQLKLFQDARLSDIPNLPNLENFFGELTKNIRLIDRKLDPEAYVSTMRGNGRRIRERVLKYLMVRRTRSEISRFYSEDLTEQNLKFPEVEAPKPCFYKLSEKEDRIFHRTLSSITGRLSYARYRPLVSEYYSGSLNQNQTTALNNLASFMKILLVKRLESSFNAFRLTLGRFIRSHEHFIEAYEQNGRVYVSKNKTARVFEYLDAGDLEALDRLIDNEDVDVYNSNLFQDRFIEDLRADLKVLREIETDWKGVKDPKWDELKELLSADDSLKKSRILIFTESKETAEYLNDQIEHHLDEKPILYSGASKKSVRQKVIENFDARAHKRKSEHRILVTTDALAEGVSLHRSNVIINYDIPWNPTRMMQRVGRVNRVDTHHDKVFTFNFLPSKQGNDAIGLQEAAEAKIEAFIEMLGSDAKLLTENEEVKSFSLFDSLLSKEAITGEDESEEDSELRYLKVIREIQEHDKDLFSKVKKLPRKARSSRKQDGFSNSLVTYFRVGKLDKFYLAQGAANRVQELDFIEAARLFESEERNKSAVRGGFYDLLSRNQAELLRFMQEDAERVHAPKGGHNVAVRLAGHLDFFVMNNQLKDFTEDEEAFYLSAVKRLRDGGLAKKAVNKLWKGVQRSPDARDALELLKKEIDFIPEAGAENQNRKREIRTGEVILSGQFI